METTNANLLIGALLPTLFIVLYTLCFIPEISSGNKKTNTPDQYRFCEIPVAIPIFKKGYRRNPDNKKFSETDIKNIEKYLLLPRFRLRFYEDKYVLFRFLDINDKYVGMARYNYIDLEAFLELDGDKTDIFSICDNDFNIHAMKYYLHPIVITGDNNANSDYHTIMSNDIEDLIIYSLFFYRNATFILSSEKELASWNGQDNMMKYYIDRLASDKAKRYFNLDESSSYRKFLVCSLNMDLCASTYNMKEPYTAKTKIASAGKKTLTCFCNYYKVKWVETEPAMAKGKHNNGNKAT